MIAEKTAKKGEKMSVGKKKVTKNSKKSFKGIAGTVSYRLKCSKTANGLSHFVMYGDVRKDKALL